MSKSCFYSIRFHVTTKKVVLCCWYSPHVEACMKTFKIIQNYCATELLLLLLLLLLQCTQQQKNAHFWQQCQSDIEWSWEMLIIVNLCLSQAIFLSILRTYLDKLSSTQYSSHKLKKRGTYNGILVSFRAHSINAPSSTHPMNWEIFKSNNMMHLHVPLLGVLGTKNMFLGGATCKEKWPIMKKKTRHTHISLPLISICRYVYQVYKHSLSSDQSVSQCWNPGYIRSGSKM